MKNAKFKIFCAVSLALFNLMSAFLGTYAWYTSSDKIDAAGMQVQMYTHELDMSYKVYKYSEEEKGIINATNQRDALTLNEYDSVFKDRNGYTPIIIEFLLTGIALEDNLPISITTHCNNNTPSDKVTSNIIELKFGLPSISSTSPETLWTESVEYFSGIDGIRFKRGNTKQQDIYYNLTGYQEYVHNGALDLFIQVDYAEDLIDIFEFDITDSTTTAFENDLTLISCDIEE